MLGLLLGNFLGFLHEPVAPNGLLSTFRGKGETQRPEGPDAKSPRSKALEQSKAFREIP